MLLAKRGKVEDALAHLNGLAVETIPQPDWRCRIHQTYGDLYAAPGRPADATAAYRQAVAVSGASADLVKAAEEKMPSMARQGGDEGNSEYFQVRRCH
jgi:predicted negative regulator of RcsB-dependent stress response